MIQKYKKKCKKVILNKGTWDKFTLSDGLLIFKGKIYIGMNTDLRQTIIQALHDSPVGGYSGITTTYRCIRLYFFWPGIKADINKFVQECDVFQRYKNEQLPYPGLLQPLEVPERAWIHIIMDFVEGLPNSEGKEVIMVMVDRFSKYNYVIGLSHSFTAVTIVRQFMDHIYRLHGLPKSIIINKNTIFLKHFWKELFSQLGTQLKFTTPYRPIPNLMDKRRR